MHFFLMNEFLMAAPLILYVGYRLRKLFARRLFKNLSTAAYVLLLAGYPLSEYLSHGAGGPSTRFLMLAGGYALPVLLYLVLFVVAADLILGLLWLVRVVSKATILSPKFRRARLAVYLLVPAAIVGWGIYNFNHLRVKDYSIEVPRKSASIGRLKVVYAADFHLGERTAARFMERFVDLVNAQRPDVILIGGDVFEGDRRNEVTEERETQFLRLRATYGVFGVPGNHEGYGGNRNDFFAKAGVRLLQDEVVRVDEAFTLAGRKDEHARTRKSIAELLNGTPDDLPVILLDHKPTDLDNASRSIADIQLSGHTHHGQLFPANLVTQHRYELDWGHKKKRNTHIFVTSGVQLWGPPVRTVGSSEILVIDVILR
jgi:predicted MPP superfamily phosphohydrolase